MKLDVTLRSRIARGAPALLWLLAGGELAAALPTEFPDSREQRLDTLLRLTDGRLLHLEWQADFDGGMPWRMLRYRGAIAERWPQHPVEQVVIQVGGSRRIADPLSTAGLSFCYRVVDARELDPAPLVASPAQADNLLALICGPAPARGRLRAILSRLATLDDRSRRDALTPLLILAGARGTTTLLLEEINAMPLQIDTDQAPYLAELVRKGRIEGEARGEARGEAKALLRLMEKRFGPLSDAVRDRLQTADPAAVENWFDRAIDAPTLEAVFAGRPAN